MELLKQKLLTLWVRYKLHLSLQRAAEIVLSFIIISGTATTVVTVTPIRDKLFPPKTVVPKTVAAPTAAVNKPVTPVAKPTSSSSKAPSVTAPSLPVTQAATVTLGSKPLSVSDPSPGSEVKQLVPSTGSGTSSGSTPPGSSLPNPPALVSGGYDSANWSGYAALNGNFSAVSGTWTVPSLSNTSSETSGDAAWVGIGGVSSNDLIQAGTEDTVTPNGSVSVFAFYELLPAPSMEIISLQVSVGDSITVALTEVSSGQWTVSITDNTTGQNYSATVAYSSSDSSAEWIEEEPSYQDGTLLPLDNFSQVVFSGDSTTDNGTPSNISTSNASAIQLVDNTNKPLVTPSVLVNSGTGFWAIHD